MSTPKEAAMRTALEAAAEWIAARDTNYTDNPPTTTCVGCGEKYGHNEQGHFVVEHAADCELVSLLKMIQEARDL